MTTSATPVETAVVAAVEGMTAALQRADLGAVLARYTPDAAVAFEPGVPVTGQPALAAGFGMFSALQPRFSYPQGHDVMVAGDLALHIAPWQMAGVAPDGAPVVQRGLSVAVLHRGRDGRWLLALDNPHGDRRLR